MLTISPEEGYCFTDETTVFYDGDSSLLAQGYVIASGKFLASTINYYVTDPTIGITEQTAESITLWPNPATNILYLDVMEGTSVSIFDMAGRLVRRQPYEGQIDVRSLVPGIYALKAEGSMIRFVKE